MNFVVSIIYWEKFLTGILLCAIGLTLLIYVVFLKKKKSFYLTSIPFFTVIWGVTGLIGFFTREKLYMEVDAGGYDNITLIFRHYSINIVHWIFVFQYYRTSLMVPKIFHGIMIDDFIEGGKHYKLNSSL